MKQSTRTNFVKMIKSLLLIVVISCTSASYAAFVHPGMLHTATDLTLIKSRVLSGKEPWKSAFIQMKNSKYGDLTIAARPFADVHCGPYNVPNIGGDEFYQDGNFAYTMALLWAVTGDQRYAEKSIEILNAWSYKLVSVTNSNRELKVGVAGIKYLNAAEIIKYTYTGWSTQDQNKFKSMILDVWYNVIKDFKPATTNGNWDAAIEQTMMCIGIFLDRQDIFDKAYERLTKGKVNGSIQYYFSETGQCQESGRDQGHTQMGISYLCNACEVAWVQGYDAYSLYDNRLLKGYEYTSKFMLGEDVPYTKYKIFNGSYVYGDTISQDGRGSYSPIYELVYHHYHGRKNLSMPYTWRVLKQIRNEQSKDGFIPWTTLAWADENMEITPVVVPNINMSQWEFVSGSSSVYKPLPKGYGVRSGSGSSYEPFFSRSEETFEGQPAIQTTWTGTTGNANYFITPYVDLDAGDYEIVFYVKGSGFIRTLNLCTSNVAESDRRSREPTGTTGFTYSTRPMGNTVTAQLFRDWTPIRVMVTVTQQGSYSLNFAHNNINGDPDNPLLISGISMNKLASSEIPQGKLVQITNIGMSNWSHVDGSSTAYQPLPDGYGNGGNNAATRSTEYYSRSTETFNGHPVMKMTYGGSAGSCAYFITPSFYLPKGEYELKFYVKGKGYFRSVNVCTVNTPEENRRTASSENLTSGVGATYILRPMGTSSKAQTIADWTLKSQVFAVDTAGLYQLNFGHNNETNGNEFYVSGISLTKTDQPEENADCLFNDLLLYDPSCTKKHPEKLPQFDYDVSNYTVELPFTYSGGVPYVYPIGKNQEEIIVEQATSLLAPNNIATINMKSTDGSVTKNYTVTFEQSKDFISGCFTDFKSTPLVDFIVPNSGGVFANEKLFNHGLYWGDNSTRPNSSGSYELITPPLVNGMGIVSFYVKDYVNVSSQDINTSSLVVRYRMHTSDPWIRIDSIPAADITSEMGWVYKSYVLNKVASLGEGTPEVSFCILQTGGQANNSRDFVLDDFRITAYAGTSLKDNLFEEGNLKVYPGNQSVIIEQEGNVFYQLYTLTGQLVSSGYFTGKASVPVRYSGLYIAKVGTQSKKVVVK